MSDPNPQQVVPPCPRWCTNPANHPFSEEVEPVRFHQGPMFGEHLRAEAIEYLGNSHLDHQVMVVPNAAEDFDKPNQLLRLAGDAVNAAIWLQAHPGDGADRDAVTVLAPEELAAMKVAFGEFIDERVDQALRAQVRGQR